MSRHLAIVTCPVSIPPLIFLPVYDECTGKPEFFWRYIHQCTAQSACRHIASAYRAIWSTDTFNILASASCRNGGFPLCTKWDWHWYHWVDFINYPFPGSPKVRSGYSRSAIFRQSSDMMYKWESKVCGNQQKGLPILAASGRGMLVTVILAVESSAAAMVWKAWTLDHRQPGS